MDSQKTGGSATAISGLPFAEAVKAGHLLFISGQVGVAGAPGQTSADIPFEQEVRQTMTQLGQVLERQGLNYGDLVQVTIYLTEMSNYAETNKVYSGYFRDGFPARVCIAVKELPLKARIEISAIAIAREPLG